MIHELLTAGAENARTGKELANILKTNIRNVTATIEIERRDGWPICADPSGGYYLAKSPEELTVYCKRLFHRAGELHKTRRRLLAVLETMLEQKRAEKGS